MPVDIDRNRLHEVSQLELFAKEVVEGFIVGMHKSPFHGFSVEFAEHRQYNQGDSTRHIDWKLFARADQNFRYRTVEEHTSTAGPIPGLETQEGVSMEFGAEIFADNNRYRATIYSIDLDNEIAFDSSGFLT